jgi:glycosyltransferase involved in cell wall biosynthesis
MMWMVAALWYAAAIGIARLCGGRRSHARTGRAVVIGTFHNPGWYLSHAVPLARSGLREVIVVTHDVLPAIEGVRLAPPPRWLTRLAGRACSKFVWALHVGRQSGADVFIGYHIIPNATMALAAARLLGRAACYQMTGGPVELLGGGYLATENQVLGRLGAPSPRLERLALRAAAAFDLVVVRGQSAARFVLERAPGPRVAVIPGSIDLARFPESAAERRCDLVFVGRLAPTKQPLQFVDIVAAVRHRLPGTRARIVGDGPLMADVRRRIGELALDEAIEVRGQTADVAACLADARVFVLTSRSEGLSIAMAEAMACGVVPVVADVGDLGDLVTDGRNGFLIEPGNLEQYADRAVAILSDDAWRRQLSAAAARDARTRHGLTHIASLWREQLVAPAPRSGATTLKAAAAAVGLSERRPLPAKDAER